MCACVCNYGKSGIECAWNNRMCNEHMCVWRAEYVTAPGGSNDELPKHAY
jgi:hypothetical protein